MSGWQGAPQRPHPERLRALDTEALVRAIEDLQASVDRLTHRLDRLEADNPETRLAALARRRH